MGRKPPSKVPARWIRNESDKAAIKAGCWFDEDAAAKVCGFFPRFLRHSKGRYARQPLELAPWQVDFLSRLFGWKNADGFRRFRQAYLEIPKKNGKSTLLSGLCLYGLIEEPGAEVYTGAVDREQATIVFGEAVRMVEASPELSARFQVRESIKKVFYRANNAKFEAMSADVPSKDGVNGSMCVLDEVHRFKNDALYEVMEYAGAARDQPLLIAITTAGTNRHSLCYRLHQQAVRIAEGATEDLAFLGVIYAADPELDDLDDPETWRKANPGLGSIIKESDFAAEYRKAKRLPRTLNNFLRLRLNVWTEQAVRWLPLSRWDALAIEPPDLSGERCYAALDISSVTDLTSLSLAFADGDLLHLRTFYFVPEETAELRSEMDKVPYSKWGEDSHLILTPGNATDHEFILEYILGTEATDDREARPGLVDKYEIAGIGLDPWNGQHIANRLTESGLNVALIRQGYGSLSGPSKSLERMLLAGRLSHDGNPADRWCVGNVATEEDSAGNIKPSKKKSTERIDGVVSMVMALGLAMGPEAPTPEFLVL
jgi:phage terminase large subunit-like protein